MCTLRGRKDRFNSGTKNGHSTINSLWYSDNYYTFHCLIFTETKDSKNNSIYIFLSIIPCPNPWDHNGFNIRIFLSGKLMNII